MGAPSKPIELVKGHRTKAEIESRRKAEAALATGKPIREYDEVKNDPVAHQFFKRTVALLREIHKNDALTEPVINRYCMIQSECAALGGVSERLRGRLKFMDDHSGDFSTQEYTRHVVAIEKLIYGVDKSMQQKRKMLFDIEKESLMTVLAQVRSISKKPDEQEEESPMAKFLRERNKNMGR